MQACASVTTYLNVTRVLVNPNEVDLAVAIDISPAMVRAVETNTDFDLVQCEETTLLIEPANCSAIRIHAKVVYPLY